MKFRFLENIATADVAFEAYGKNLEELFENCGLALTEVMVDPSTMSNVKCQMSNIKLKSRNLDNLLFDFLSELVFIKDHDSLLFTKIKVKINRSSGIYYLTSDLFGEPIDPKYQHLRVDVKGVTKHIFKTEKEKEGYKATVVLDI
jgi:SHS2 domain-containing protein